MKFILFIMALFPMNLLSQDISYKTIEVKKITDSSFSQVLQISIQNNNPTPICLQLSTAFKNAVIDRDTVNLGQLFDWQNCPEFDLAVSQQDIERGYYNNPVYPLVLFPKAAFCALVGIRMSGCEYVTLRFTFYDDKQVNYCEFGQNIDEIRWPSNLPGKFKVKKFTIINSR